MRGFVVASLMLVLSATVSAQEPSKTEIPLSAEAFAATPFMDDPELSPNGQYLAARMASQGRQYLMIISMYGDPTVHARVSLSDGKVDVDWWRWVNDDWLLIGVSATTQFEGEDVRAQRVLSLNRTTGTMNRLAWDVSAQNGANVIWVANDGTPRMLLGIQRSIYVGLSFWTEVIDVDVSTGKFKTVVKPRVGVMSYYADGAGAVRLGYGYDDATRTGRLLYRPEGSGLFKVIDRANYRRDQSINFPSTFLPQADRALTISDDEDGFSSLYELDLSTMARGKKLFGLKGYDIDGTIENRAGNGIDGIYVTEDAPRVEWLDPGLRDTQALIDKAVGSAKARIVSWNADRTQLVVKVGGADQAGAYYLYNRAQGGKMQRFAYVDETLKMRKLSPVSTISYKARDGVEIRGILTLPKGKAAKGLPLILLPHGGPEARDSEGYDWWVQFLAWRGYAVFQPNYRGSTGFGTKFLKLGNGEWGLKMQDDLNDAVTSLAQAGTIDPKRVCIAGASYGGYAALRAAQRDGSLYRCAISYAGVSDLAGMRRYDGQFLNGGGAADGWRESAPDFASVSPLRNPSSFGSPVLIMHGKLDLRVPVAQSRQMAEKLKAAGKDYRYVEQPLGDHHFSRAEDRLQFLQETEAFLAKYNPS